MTMPQNGPLPAAAFIVIGQDGTPHLSVQRCRACGADFLEAERLACGRCAGREGFDAHEPGTEGTLHSYSIVYRGFPGVAVPFVSAIVDLDDGPALKGNLRGIPIEPEAIKPGMRVRMVFDDALGRKDQAGNSYVSHFFEPLQPAQEQQA